MLDICDFFVLDDGSIDGTSEALRSSFPKVRVLTGDGSLYWAGGMRAAWNAAISQGGYRAFVWVNDDVEFFERAVQRALERALSADRREPKIWVGTVVEERGGAVAYGGCRRPSPHTRPLYFERVFAPGKEVDCETFNGNFVVVPIEVVKAIGGIDECFVHGLADYDYGFRAARAGFGARVLGFEVGSCRRNPWVDPAAVQRMSIGQRWKRMTGPKMYPIGSWYEYVRRHAGMLWPIFLMRPYIEVAFPWAFKRLR